GQLKFGKLRQWNLRSLLVVAQVAISIIVLVCAGLFIRSLILVQNADPGFKIDNLITMRLAPGLLGYSNAEGKRFFSELLNRIEAQPGVHAASLVVFLPLGDSSTQRGQIIREGEAPLPPGQGLVVDANVVAPKYFETMGTPLLLGRDFTARDNDDAPDVVIVNQEFARKLYGSEENALGKRFHARGLDSPLLEIIGIAKNGLYRSLYENPRPYIILPEYQKSYESEMTLLVRATTATDFKAVAESVRREIVQMDSRVPVFGLQLAEQNLTYAYWGPRLAAGLAMAFGILALVLTMMGLYGVMTYTVSQRVREIGIRMALGAQTSHVLKMVLKQGMLLTLTGVAIGLTGAFLVTRVIASLLFGISTTDLVTFTSVAMLLLLIAVLACYLPARRATKIDPMVALRYE
ncbi:MAG: FtsX-like permease family protein, partial [Acidobacteriota bacterium]